MSDTVHTVSDGRLLRLTLNRPQKRNALNLELCRALVEALEGADRDPKIGAILLSANGPSFCAGMDLHEIDHVDDGALSLVHEQLFTIGARLSKPLVAAVHGAALAGGTGLVANCHIVVASEDATFGLTEIRLGLWPFLVFRAVAAAIGERRATELSLTGRIFGAGEAQEIGLGPPGGCRRRRAQPWFGSRLRHRRIQPHRPTKRPPLRPGNQGKGLEAGGRDFAAGSPRGFRQPRFSRRTAGFPRET